MIKSLAIIVLIGVTIADPIPKIRSRARFPEGRIVGGENTTIERVPYQVSISFGGDHYCGGSIVNENWVLTAAHCAGISAKFYRIRAGSTHSDFGGSVHKVSRVIVHEKYVTDKAGIPSNDIALFQLTNPIKMDRTRQPVELYKINEEAKAGAYAIITGWGSTSGYKSSEPYQLQTVSVPIISKDECKMAYKNFTNFSAGQICAAYPNGGKDACQGDSGGPLVIDRRLAGVVSWGNGCGYPDYPGVYTEVAYFRKWITEVIKA